MKNECMRLWSDKVQALPELLCFLQLCHRINGPLPINNCEKVIENLINPNSEPNDCPLVGHGRDMDVKRLFELKMFRSLPPPNRMKVQPVDCTLRSLIRFLPKGLTTEIYKILFKSKRERTLEEIIAIMMSDELGRRNDIKKSILEFSEVMTIDGNYVRLRNDDEFFVLTSVAK
ncbi:hypothetical protein KIN20_005980 [Parelaphostrongylus tenuis]|uniref:Uncharacterized protein n=1 Tax=Parelaphostrongylus tenuis TaxID=148309 RepID=A0AAD5M5C6_PARTN|nr:hypothetical protein KIN20_005980 [Parelaphostrongylus tenuis]